MRPRIWRHALPGWIFTIGLLFVALGVPVVAQPLSGQDPATGANTTDPNAARQLNENDQLNSADRNDNGPTRLRQTQRRTDRSTLDNTNNPLWQQRQWLPEEKPGEFELFVQSLLPQDASPIRRLGADLMVDPRLAQFQTMPLQANRAQANPADDAQDGLPQVPPEYVVRPGDEVQLAIWGSADADLRLTVDRSGRIVVPRVGAISVAGTRYADLYDVIDRRVAQVFRNYHLSVAMGQLRGIRVFVTGFAKQPGSMTVNSLSSVLHVLTRAGGPNAAGSFRNIQLRRANKVVAQFDLYELLIKGDRSADQVVQADDVVHIGPVGDQVAIIGSVNQPAIVELKQGEGVQEVLRMAGGFNSVALRNRVAVERLSDRAGRRVTELNLADSTQNQQLGAGDVVRVFSAVTTVMPKERQNKRVRVEGEVLNPGEYVLPAGSHITDALAAAGGVTNAAYVYGTEFNRETVRLAQQENFDRALRHFETELAKASAGKTTVTAEEGAAQAANTRLLDRLRQLRPNGRVVLQVNPTSRDLPDLALEDGDRIYIPSKPTTIGVFGSVFSAGSYLLGSGQSLDDYIRLAGGPTRGADTSSVFVIRANGSVVSARQDAGWFGENGRFASMTAQPGDTIFVPEELDKTTFLQAAKDWTQVLYQFGVGIAAINTIGK